MAKIQNVQGLRAIAAVLVVFVHLSGSHGFTAENFGGVNPLGFLYGFGNAGVDLFFAISGFIMIVTTSRLEHTPRNAGIFLLKRAARIYPTYILVTVGILLARQVIPGFGGNGESPDVLASLLLLPQDSMPVLFVGWTLVYEMYFYLWFTASILAPKTWQMPIMLAWGLLTVALALTVQTDNPFLALAAGPLNLEFLFGVIVGKLALSGRLALPPAFIAVGAAWVLATYFVFLQPGDNLPNTWTRVLFVGIPMALVLYGFVGIESRGRVLPDWINNFGDSSYALYLTHVLALKVAGIALGIALPSGNLWAVVGAALALAACCVAAVFFRKWVEDPLRKLAEKRIPRPTKAELVRA
jgi:exopolysaccharide production protein ExoZ